jgi:hypothetical protein
MHKSKVFDFDYGNAPELFCPDIFKKYWTYTIEQHKKNGSDPLFPLIKKICNKHHATYKVTFYELFERLKIKDDEYGYKNEMLAELQNIQATIKEGDFVSTYDNQMLGFYYFDGYNFMPTTGNGGLIIPEQAYKMIEQYGIEFFSDLPYDPCVKIPKSMVTDDKDTIHLFIKNKQN